MYPGDNKKEIHFMSFLRSRRSRILAAGGTLAGLVAVVAAVAYFTGGQGTGAGSATVGSASALTVSAPSSSGGPIYPGAGTQVLSFTVTNPSSGHQAITSFAPTIASSGGNVTQGGSPVSGCSASWFHATADGTNPSFPDDLVGGGTAVYKADVTMDNAATSQDQCQGVQPDVNVTVN